MDDLTMMQLAYQAAQQADPAATWENPRVGAVIVKDGAVIATGYHHQFGHQHAEVVAMNQVEHPADLVGATMYVTLEPCAHIGKVGACADALVTAKLGRVVIGQGDPNPHVSGRGVAKLQQAGIAVTLLNQQGSTALNPAFHHFFETQRPYVTLKLAQSIDGFIAAKRGQATKLTDDQANVAVHQQRAQMSAIMVGSETALTDAPQLTVRHVPITHQQPWRVIVDRRGRLQHHPAFFDDRTLIYTTNTTFAQQVPQAVFFDGELGSLLDDLGQRGIQSLLVEGGGALVRAFLAANLWQRFDIYQTDAVLGTGIKGVVGNQGTVATQTRVGNALHQVIYREAK